MITQGYIELINSVTKNQNSVLEMNVFPGEKTPWHYHTLFAETFEILKGSLEVGKGENIHHLKEGDIVTIMQNERHYFNNISKDECILKVTLSPGNMNFEYSLLILKGLAKDGLANVSGTPRKFSDLALFIYLNNSQMVGFQKVAEPIFSWVAKSAIKKGRLNELIQNYCKEAI